jgi:hypothetical protein
MPMSQKYFKWSWWYKRLSRSRDNRKLPGLFSLFIENLGSNNLTFSSISSRHLSRCFQMLFLGGYEMSESRYISDVEHPSWHYHDRPRLASTMTGAVLCNYSTPPSGWGAIYYFNLKHVGQWLLRSLSPLHGLTRLSNVTTRNEPHLIHSFTPSGIFKWLGCPIHLWQWEWEPSRNFLTTTFNVSATMQNPHSVNSRHIPGATARDVAFHHLPENPVSLPHESLFPEDAYEGETYWADLPTGARTRWINKQQRNEVKREFMIVWRVSNNKSQLMSFRLIFLRCLKRIRSCHFGNTSRISWLPDWLGPLPGDCILANYGE